MGDRVDRPPMDRRLARRPRRRIAHGVQRAHDGAAGARAGAAHVLPAAGAGRARSAARASPVARRDRFGLLAGAAGDDVRLLAGVHGFSRRRGHTCTRRGVVAVAEGCHHNSGWCLAPARDARRRSGRRVRDSAAVHHAVLARAAGTGADTQLGGRPVLRGQGLRVPDARGNASLAHTAGRGTRSTSQHRYDVPRRPRSRPDRIRTRDRSGVARPPRTDAARAWHRGLPAVARSALAALSRPLYARAAVPGDPRDDALRVPGAGGGGGTLGVRGGRSATARWTRVDGRK